VPHIVQNAQGFGEGQGKRHRSASAVGYMFVPLVYQGRRMKEDDCKINEMETSQMRVSRLEWSPRQIRMIVGLRRLLYLRRIQIRNREVYRIRI
jgi:hypothetical protein